MVGGDTFTLDDLDVLVDLVATMWLGAAGCDWSARAGTIEWSCTRTADHAVDTVLAPALFLASRRTDAYPPGEPFTVGVDATPQQLVAALRTVANVLAAVVRDADPAVRAVIWRGATAPPRDFVPRAGFELLLHAHDISEGLGVPFDPPRDLCERMRRHTHEWPYWTSPGWSTLTMRGDPWLDILRSSGRLATESP